MTASPPAVPGMPSEEEIARLICGIDPPDTWLDEARAILSLIRPAFEAKEREHLQRLTRAMRQAQDWRAAAEAAEAKLAQAVEAKVEIRRNDDGTIDEVVASGAQMHLEQLDKGHWYLGVYSAAGDCWQFWLYTNNPARTRIAINDEHSPARSASAAARGA